MDAREQLAEYAHEAWSDWMKYLFEKSWLNPETGRVEIPPVLVQRWKRQMNTPYAELPESEKESDRVEADRMLAIVGAALRTAQSQLAQERERVKVLEECLRYVTDSFSAYLYDRGS